MRRQRRQSLIWYGWRYCCCRRSALLPSLALAQRVSFAPKKPATTCVPTVEALACNLYDTRPDLSWSWMPEETRYIYRIYRRKDHRLRQWRIRMAVPIEELLQAWNSMGKELPFGRWCACIQKLIQESFRQLSALAPAHANRQRAAAVALGLVYYEEGKYEPQRSIKAGLPSRFLGGKESGQNGEKAKDQRLHNDISEMLVEDLSRLWISTEPFLYRGQKKAFLLIWWKRHHVFVVEEKNVFSATAVWWLCWMRRYLNVAVRSDRQKKRELEQFLWTVCLHGGGVAGISLSIWRSARETKTARRLYQRLGFKRTDFVNYYENPVNAVLMTKEM